MKNDWWDEAIPVLFVLALLAMLVYVVVGIVRRIW